MENQHRKIEGYRELSQEEIDLMNQIKSLGSDLHHLIEKVECHVSKQTMDACAKKDEATLIRLGAADPDRFIDLARDNFQTALMQLTRAVAQPTNF